MIYRCFLYLCTKFIVYALEKLAQYRIDLKNLPQGPSTYRYELDDSFFTEIDAPEVRKGNVRVHLTVTRASEAFRFDFQTEGVAVVTCDRCLDEMEQEVSSENTLYVKFGMEYAEEDGNLIVVPEDEDGINVAWYIYEFVALAIPIKHVHAPGECNKEMMGKLSEVLCSEVDEDDLDALSTTEDLADSSKPIDPRWSELKKILDNN